MSAPLLSFAPSKFQMFAPLESSFCSVGTTLLRRSSNVCSVDMTLLRRSSNVCTVDIVCSVEVPMSAPLILFAPSKFQCLLC